MPQFTRDDFVQAVNDTLTANGGEMEYDALLSALSQYAMYFRMLEFMRRQGVLKHQVYATPEGHRHMVRLAS